MVRYHRFDDWSVMGKAYSASTCTFPRDPISSLRTSQVVSGVHGGDGDWDIDRFRFLVERKCGTVERAGRLRGLGRCYNCFGSGDRWSCR